MISTTTSDVKQEVKRTVTSSSSSNSSSQNMAFVSSPSNTNEVNTANVQVNTVNSPYSTANLSDATVYAFLNLLRVEFNKSEFNLATYKRGLASVEEQLIFCDQIVVLKRETSFKDSEINALKSEIEQLKKEKESNQIKIDKFENALRAFIHKRKIKDMLIVDALGTCQATCHISQSSRNWMEGHVSDKAVHKELGDRMERAVTTASSLEAEQDSEMEITATIDGKVKTVIEASIRRHLKLEDSDGISLL
ncbi:hypothetical protein Tco_0527708 [Tanacetum coccineum]